MSGDRFISGAKSIGTSDHHLNDEKAIDCVRNLLDEHEKRISKLSQHWSAWQQSQSGGQQVNQVLHEVSFPLSQLCVCNF